MSPNPDFRSETQRNRQAIRDMGHLSYAPRTSESWRESLGVVLLMVVAIIAVAVVLGAVR